MPVDIHSVSFKIAKKYHYATSGKNWKRVSKKITNKATGGSWNNPNISRMSCAVRVSLALYRAGVRFPPTQYEWTRPSGAVYPSSAGNYPKLLKGGEVVKGKKEIAGRVGVIHFTLPGVDHVTLWDGEKCHYNDGYFSLATKITFWEMAP